MNDLNRRQYIEEPKLEHYEGSDTFADPPKQRTSEQQAKQDKLLKLERRQAGEETNRSRSSSRRERRKRVREQMDAGKLMKTGNLKAFEEADANGDMDMMRAFERIGPDSTSMDGPVTMARALRGEIPVRGSNPNQPYYLKPEKGQANESALKDADGLKLSIEANLDVEIELKASIRGDLTLALFA